MCMTVDELLSKLTPKDKEFIYRKYLVATNLTAQYYKSTPKTEWVCDIVKQKTGCNSIFEVETASELNVCCDAVKNSGKDSGNQYSSPIKKYIEAIKNECSRKQSSIFLTALQIVYYGSPGCGKSYEVQKILESIDKTDKFRTTFHPDSDYYSFVGSYKPKMENNIVTYDYSPRIFTRAYIKAWENILIAKEKNIDKPCILIIEEINRGNCAQIFGDLFQLLDRDNNGYSEYPIKADEDLITYIKNNCKNPAAYSNDELRLPPNLYIVATMNTSDQSLFPMDSAFKRRWAWKYVPIDYNNQVSGGFKITIGGIAYGWHDFLEKINDKIYKVTNSEDKMLGNFFIKSSIDEEEFVDKVMFYLWNDVLKLEYASGNDYFFKKDDKSKFKFSDLYDSNTRTDTLKSFMKYLGL